MKTILTILSLLTGFVVQAKSMCYEHKFAKNDKNFISIRVNIPTKNQERMLQFKTKSNFYSGSYYCMKKETHFRCVGDNDSGKFSIYSDHFKIDHLSLSQTDENILEIKKIEKNLNFKKVNCN